MHEIWRDLRVGVRSLLRRPAFLIVAAATLAIGIGANAAVFSVVHAVLLRPLPYAAPDELVVISSSNQAKGVESAGVSGPDARDVRERATGLTDALTYGRWGLVYLGGDRPVDVPTAIVQPGLLALLGVDPILGRTFEPEEDLAGRDKVVVLSHEMWQTQFGGDPDIIGSKLNFERELYEVVGVMPPGFHFPSDEVRLWHPRPRETEWEERDRRSRPFLGRLAPGVSLERAREEARSIAAALAEEYPDTNQGWAIDYSPMHASVVEDVRPALVFLAAAVALVLLVACANVASLLVARGLERRREVALRLTLGAGRGRIVRQLLVESTILAAVGCGLGLGLASALLRLLVATGPERLPRLGDVSLDGSVMAFALAASLVASVVVGIAPALRESGVSLTGGLRSESRSSHGDRHGSRARSLLTVAEVALSVLLLAGAGLLGRSFLAAVSVDPGFRADNVASTLLYIYGYNYGDAEAQRGYVRDYLERIRRIPGVDTAGVASALPLSGYGVATAPVTIEGRPEPEPEPTGIVLVDGDFFETLRVPLRAGRVFDDFDRTGAESVAVISETAARRFFPGEDPVGRMLATGQTITGPVDDPTRARVVGVVGDVRYRSLEREPTPIVYFSHRQVATGTLNFVARTSVDADAALLSMQDASFEVDPEYPVSRAATLASLVSESTAERSFYTAILGGFAAVSLLLASVGLYGLLSYMVSVRREELGVRLAMGASGMDLARLVLGAGSRLVGIGLALGIAASLVLGRLVSGLLFGVQASDPATLVLVTTVFVVVSTLAALGPARRAARLDPGKLLGGQ